MYGGGDFDGGSAAFNGGGFMPPQATQAHDSFGSSSSSSSFKNRDSKVLLPVTVKQLSEVATTDDSHFTIDGVDLNNVVLVGRVAGKESRVTDYSIFVDDGTGVVECCKWVQDAFESEEVENITTGTYVRVHGQFRAFQGRRLITVFSIRPVTDFNEAVSHLIECIYVHFYNTKMKRVAGQSQPPPLTNSIPPSSNNLSRGFQSAPLNQPAAVSHGGDAMSNLINRIPHLLQQSPFLDMETGVHRAEIAHQLNVPMNILMEALKALTEEGSVYSTVDDDHYKSSVNA